MEVSLPLSNRVEPSKREALKPKNNSPVQPFNISTASIALPLSFILAGLLALFTGASWLVLQPEILAAYHYNANAIAATHLFALGWLCSVVMGAMYQLVPVALETKLFSERLAKIQFVFHIVGFVGMVLAFRVWNMKFVAAFGSIFAIGVALFIYNVARTLLRIPKWNVIAAAVASALGWILLTVSAGLLIASAKTGHANFMFHFNPIGAMHAHAHLGTLGFFIMLIVGVSYKLIPMFTLSEIQNHRRALVSVILLNVGLAGSFVSILLQLVVKPLFALIIVAAFVIYGREMTAILRARKRRALDWGVRYFLTAIALLAPLSILALILSWPKLPLNPFTGQLENVYGFVAFVGVISFAVIGMLYKIIPFLVWFGIYSKHIGCTQVPALAEMVSEKLQRLGYGIFLTALAVTIFGILFSNAMAVRIGSAFFAASLTTLALNVGKILSHYFQPKLAPLAAPKNYDRNKN
ncbi:MAG TPA: hypothetical protein VHG71_05265 [Verrucomicrobiae bacterium]|nr:hypothetical protein [Verrucomicrobiae bacterium]